MTQTANYPTQAPEFTLKLGPLSHLETVIADSFHQLFIPGNVVLYSWIDCFKQTLESEWETDTAPVVYEPTLPESSYISGDAITESRSVFVAHCTQVTSVDQVSAFQATVLSNKRIANATHNILAYRIVNNGTVIMDSDDDGETAAGSRLAHLLSLTNCANVAVIVTRWYGGVKLGPSRFKIIHKAARNVLEKGGFIG